MCINGEVVCHCFLQKDHILDALKAKVSCFSHFIISGGNPAKSIGATLICAFKWMHAISWCKCTVIRSAIAW